MRKSGKENNSYIELQDIQRSGSKVLNLEESFKKLKRRESRSKDDYVEDDDSLVISDLDDLLSKDSPKNAVDEEEEKNAS